MSNFMNRESFKQMSSLANKYKNCGLTIDIEFNRWGLILRGYWDLSYSCYEILHFNQEYSLIDLEKLQEEIGLEYLIDKFKKEFEEKVRREWNQRAI